MRSRCFGCDHAPDGTVLEADELWSQRRRHEASEVHKRRRRGRTNAKETSQLRCLAGIDLRFEPDETTIQAIHATLHATGHGHFIATMSSILHYGNSRPTVVDPFPPTTKNVHATPFVDANEIRHCPPMPVAVKVHHP